jgi:hypothetical protein
MILDGDGNHQKDIPMIRVKVSDKIVLLSRHILDISILVKKICFRN